ncbi:MAG: serine acetyltransferase [Pseudomonadota bacterium]
MKTAFWIVFIFSTFRLIPHVLLMMFGPNRLKINSDVSRWAAIYIAESPVEHFSRYFNFVFLMTRYPEFRNLFYYRTGTIGSIFRPLCRPISTLYIHTGNIGPGLFLQHGFATIISAEEIGSHCWINQQVTIGWIDKTGGPVIGDNVTINAGAKVLGNISIGSNSVVGANAVVVKDVPPNCTVVGIPAYIVRKDGIRFRESL